MHRSARKINLIFFCDFGYYVEIGKYTYLHVILDFEKEAEK